MKRSFLLIAIIAVLALALPVQAQDPLTETYIFPDGSLSFNHPAGWVLSSDSNSVYFGSSTEAFEADGPDALGAGQVWGQVYTPSATQYEFESGDLDEVHGMMASSVTLTSNEVDLTINDYPARHFDFTIEEDENSVEGLAALIQVGDDELILWAMMMSKGELAGQRDTLLAIIQSTQYAKVELPTPDQRQPITKENIAGVLALGQYGGFDGEVTALALDENAGVLAAGLYDYTEYDAGNSEYYNYLRFFDVNSGDVTFDAGLEDAYIALDFNPAGTQLAAGGYEGIFVYDVATGEATNLEPPEEIYISSIQAVAFSPDGGQLATAGYGAILLWDTATWAAPTIVEIGDYNTEDIAYSPDGSLLAVAANYYVMIVDVASGEILHEITHPDRVDALYPGGVAFSPDGSRLAATFNYWGDEDNLNYAALYDVASGEQIAATQELLNDYIDFGKIVFSSDGSFFVVDTYEGLFVFDAASGEEITRRLAGGGYPGGIAINAAGNTIYQASNGYPATIAVWVLPPQ